MDRLLENKSDFYWYKQWLDTKRRYRHEHSNEPERFPCKVISEWKDNPNGPYYYHHYFTYQQEITCDKCGHKKLIWPSSD